MELAGARRGRPLAAAPCRRTHLLVFSVSHSLGPAQDGELTYYAPPIGERDFKQPVGVLTRSCFIPNTCRAVSVTTDGDVLVWDRVELPEVASTDRRATKLLRLHAGAIGFVDTVGDMIVTGAADGHVRFFDFDFRVLAWFEDLDAGAINHVSFACQPAALEPRAGASLACPDFIVGTGNALVLACQPSMFEALTPDARRGTLLVQGQDAPVHGLAAHPLLPRFAVTGHSGLLQLWDYAEKRLLLLRMFDRLLGNCLAFSPNGKLLAIGFTNGDIKVLNGLTLKQVAAFTVSKESVTHLDFSHCSSYLAAASAEHTVSIYRPASGVGAGLEGGKEDWEFVGKHRAHTKPVVSLNFNGTADANAPPRLLSLGEDRSLIEFDLARSTIADGVQLTRPPVRIEQTSLPTACLWLPGDSPGAPPTIVAANDGYKLRTLASDSMALMHTSLGPTYGGPLTKLVLLPAAAAEGATGEDGSATGERYVAYSTYEKVVGVVKLPLDGNPNKAMGLIAHPGELTGMAVSCDGKWLITAGGADLSIHLWQVDTGALDEMAASGGEGFAPFESLIEGGKGGDFYEEMRDYFYYAQLRAQGEDTTEARRITGKVPVTEIGNLLRAFGYYPSEREIDEIVQEVRMAAAGDDDAVDFETLLRLYINHRPVLGVSKDQIGAALSVLSGGEAFAARDVLKDVLKGSGESLTPDDLAQCLRALVGAADADDALPFKVDGKAFAEDVLGFEDYGDEGAAQ